MRHIKTSSGNVLFVVLAAIALFAGLVMAMTRSDNTDSGAVLSQAEAKLHAASIMRFGSDVEQAVRRLTTIGGCDIEDVSFERAPFDGSDTDYVNPNSPTDKSCHVFHSSGGQVDYIDLNEKWLDTSFEGSYFYNEFLFTITCVKSIGLDYTAYTGNCNDGDIAEDVGELVLFLFYLKPEICSEITMSLLGHDTMFFDSANTIRTATTRYQGSFNIITAHVNFTNYSGITPESLCYFSDEGGVPAINSYSYMNTLYIQ